MSKQRKKKRKKNLPIKPIKKQLIKVKKLPPCGLYKTGIALPESEDNEEIPAGHLIMFHNHSNKGIPFLQMPKENINNFWYFHEYGPGIKNQEFIDALIPLREQGLYYLNTPLETDDAWYSELTLVQLGYNLRAEPILFIAEPLPDQNGFYFKETGYGFEDLDVFRILSPEKPFGVPEEDDEDEEEEDDFDEMMYDENGELLN